jgi:hypothetical protein
MNRTPAGVPAAGDGLERMFRPVGGPNLMNRLYCKDFKDFPAQICSH